MKQPKALKNIHLGPNDEYQEIRRTAEEFLAALARGVHLRRPQNILKIFGTAIDSAAMWTDPVCVSACEGDMTAGALSEIDAETTRSDMFECLQGACESATILVNLLRIMDRDV